MLRSNLRHPRAMLMLLCVAVGMVTVLVAPPAQAATGSVTLLERAGLGARGAGLTCRFP